MLIAQSIPGSGELIVPVERNSTNEMGGSVTGAIVQSGTVHGGVHITTPIPAPEIPHQLPPAPAFFTGRDDESAEVDVAASDVAGRPALVVISGPGGVGKSALALRWLHMNAERFPDGQLYADLGAFGAGVPVSPSHVLPRFLRAMGVHVDDIPVDLADQSALFRSVTSNKRVAVLADDAESVAQVRPLLPAAGGVVVVTSRWRLAGLALDGARLILVDALDVDAGVDLLSHALGHDRVAGEPDQARDVVTMCAGLPLALRLVAARMATKPRWPLARVVDSLSDERRRLSVLAVAGELPVGTSFDLSYRELTPAAARLYRLLGLYPGTEFGVGLAGATADVSEEEAEQLLDELLDASLLIDRGPDTYRFHDLLRLHAARHADNQDSADEREHAVHRMVLWHLDHAIAADLVVMPLRQRWGPRSEVIRQRPPAFTNPRDALDWLDRHHIGILAVLRAAVGRFDDEAWQLCQALWSLYHNRRPPLADWVATHEPGLESARRAGDRIAEARMHVQLGYGHLTVEAFDVAAEHFTAALHLGRSVRHRDTEATALEHLGLAAKGAGRLDQALDHFTAALAITDELGHTRVTVLLLRRLGETLCDAGLVAEAVAPLRRAEELAAGLGDRVLRARVSLSLAIAHTRSGRASDAVTALEEVVDTFHSTGADHYRAEALEALADAHLGIDDPVGARRHLETALVLYDRSPGPRSAKVRERLEVLGRGPGASAPAPPDVTSK
ncbi:putative ATPase [Saccharothrix saharensis]|uniref:Putative ATPase n=1 Tax=Saccharothrix saharensis TaxID=571190 RepID=A0A543JQ61_9PSEU|nr:tetratricopeptide repeat protein [Saccharothrix saharensis]TQM85001.1 putative ATPase [Saccharothrix saharensis]